MKKKDIIISSVAVVAAAAVIICAGAVVKNQIEFASARDALHEKACELKNYKILAKEKVCKYDPKLESESLDKIIVGMITYPKEDRLAPSIFAVPPTVDEVDAYLSASAFFENINMSDDRGLNGLLPVYANGRISKNSIFASDKINTGGQTLRSVEFVFWKEKGEPELAVKELIVKKGSEFDVLKEFKIIENKMTKEAHISPYICLYEILINENGKFVGNNRVIEHSITQPVDIFEIYGNSDLSKICKEAYNPVERVRLKD